MSYLRSLRNWGLKLSFQLLTQSSAHCPVLFLLLMRVPIYSCTPLPVGPIRSGVVELWTPMLSSLASLEDSVPSMHGGMNAGLQNPVCPLCIIFSSFGFPVGIQSSLQGLWAGSCGQSHLAGARGPCGHSLLEPETPELKVQLWGSRG